MQRLRLTAALSSVAVLAAGCPPPRPIEFGPRGRLTDPNVALQDLLARREKVRTVRGEAKAAIEAPQGSGKITELIAAEWPDHLRLESISFFGNPLAVLTANGSELQLHDIDRNRFTQTAATPEDAARLLPVPLAAGDVVALLLGVPPLLAAAPERALSLDERERCYVLVLNHPPAAEAIGLDPLTLRPLWVRMNAAASPTPYEARFEDYDPDSELPRTIDLRTHKPDTHVELRWRDREINTTLPEEIFTQPIPPGLTPVAP